MNYGSLNKLRIKAFCCLLGLLILVLVLEGFFCYPKTVVMFDGETFPERSSVYYLDIPAVVGKSGVMNENGELVSDSWNPKGEDYKATLKLFGVIPVRSIKVDVRQQTRLVASGECVGIKILSKGLVCVGTQPVRGEDGTLRDISQEHDIRPGDVFLEANGEVLTEIEAISLVVERSCGENVRFKVSRGEKVISKDIIPVKTETGYQLGLWMRDSAAGIGTLTYYNPETKAFGALGHPITDADTGTIMPVSEGELLGAKVIGVRKGEKGEPGELKGFFRSDEPPVGKILSNNSRGVFGIVMNDSQMEHAMAVSSGNNVKVGKASILSSVSGESVESYDVEIQKNLDLFGSHKDMVIRVTDARLLEKTGGIVQGMSGSPIIQNGRIVGAVTHVFVNDPTRGYGIFIENMLAEAGNFK